MSDEFTRNAGGHEGDDVGEMTRHPRLDDRSADALFSGRLPADREDLADVAALAERVRLAASQAPTPLPNAVLAAVLADGLATDESDLPVTVRRGATAPAVRGTGRSNPRRKKTMLELLIAKLAGLGLLAKTGIAGAAVLAGATGAGFTGSLPPQTQAGFDRAFGEASAEETEELVELVVDDSDSDSDSDTTDAEAGERPEVPGDEGRATADEAAGDNGADGRATADAAATDGRAFGESKATEARENAPAGPQTGEEASTSGRQNGEEASTSGRHNGEEAATSGRDRAPEAPSGDGTADDTPATDAGQPEEVPAGSSDTGEAASSSAKEGTPAAGRP
ncbi:MAG: hypothetical protein WEB03_08370 [Nitriliruptor sp.]|uniref:hypothetical protein n=1 Tax=Nitriliruptor sp. TaxID=2448056 RepID=UPI0034A0A913